MLLPPSELYLLFFCVLVYVSLALTRVRVEILRGPCLVSSGHSQRAYVALAQIIVDVVVRFLRRTMVKCAPSGNDWLHNQVLTGVLRVRQCVRDLPTLVLPCVRQTYCRLLRHSVETHMRRLGSIRKGFQARIRANHSRVRHTEQLHILYQLALCILKLRRQHLL